MEGRASSDISYVAENKEIPLNIPTPTPAPDHPLAGPIYYFFFKDWYQKAD